MTTPTPEEVEEQLKVFNLKPGATLDEIKKRKAFLTKVMHEDVVAPNLKDQAREEMIKINAAWEVINAWFQANPDEKATPNTESAKASAGKSSQADDEDEEDWKSYEKKKQKQWSGEGVSLAELDRKRRHDMIVRSRRNLIIKVKVAGGVLLGLGGFTSLSPANSNTAFDLWTLMLIAYLIWLFHPKAKAKTEQWIETVEL